MVQLLLAEDDRIVRITVRDALEDAGYEVTECADGASAALALEGRAFDIVLTDVRLPGMDGITLFRRARELQPSAAVLLMTAYGATDDAVAVMREGARDYFLKPFELDELLLRINRVRDEVTFRRRIEQGDGPEAADGELILGESAAIRLLRDRVEAAAETDVPVLLSGETGTGKDLAARRIHERGRRARKPFLAVNCAAIPESLFEAEMFGHEKGAFTGADRRRIGRFVAASGGTLFLDEVGELSPGNQARLLRVLDASVVEPIGSNQSVPFDVRIIAASNRDLRGDVSRGSFRLDLYHRLAVIDVHAPALRERRSDIPILVRHFLLQIAERQGRPVAVLGPAVAAALAAHDFPGNVRELLHALERAIALSRGATVGLEHLPEEIARGGAAAAKASEELRPLNEAVAEFSRGYIDRALEKTGGHRGQTATLLGISRKSLWVRLRESQESDETKPAKDPTRAR